MAAAARRPERNPVENRAEWLAKNYPRTVVADALAAWAEAVGADAYVAMFREAALYEPIEVSLELLDIVLDQRPESRTTIYDTYLPWVAKTLNEKHKPILRVHRQIAAASPNDALLRSIAESRDYGETLRSRALVAGARPLGMATIDEYTELRDALIPRFGLIGRWADAERVDLGRYSLDDAWAAAYAWLNVEQPEATRDPHGITVYAWPDGWTIRELKAKADLVDEGTKMGHCTKSYAVGRDGGIRETPVSSVILLYSLRDRQNRPHATLEWLPEKQYVNQLRGRGNVLPMPKHTARMAEFRNQMFPTAAPTPVAVPAADVVRKDAKFFDGRYAIPLLGNSRSEHDIEVWGGNVYVGIDDVDEAIEDYRETLRDRGLAEEQIAKKLRIFQPLNVIGVELEPWYEWWFARRGPGMALLDNEDELVQSMRRAVDDAQGKPIFAAIRKPTGKRVGPS